MMKTHVVEVTARPFTQPGAMRGMLLYEMWIDGKVVREQISYLGMEEIKTVLSK